MRPRPSLLGAGALALAATVSACVPFGGDDCTGGAQALVAAPWHGTVAAAAPVGSVEIDPDLTMWADDAALHPDGDRLAVRCDGELCVWDVATGDRVEATVDVPGSNVAWTDTGEVMVASGYDSGEERTTVVVADEEEQCSMLAHELPLATDSIPGYGELAVGATGELVATVAGDDGRVGLWSVPERRLTDWVEPDLGQPTSVAINPTVRDLAIGGPDGPVEIWDLAEVERVRSLDVTLVDLAWHPYEPVLAGVDVETRELVLVDTETSEVLDTLPGVEVADLAWSTDAGWAPLSRTAPLAIAQVDDPEVLVWTPGGGGSDEVPEVIGLAGHTEIPRSVMWAPGGDEVYSVDGVDGVLAHPVDPDGTVGDPRRFSTPEPILD